MNTYTLQQLSRMIDALTTRVNAIDGQNLSPSVKGGLPQVITQLQSVQTDLGQIAANFENELSVINAQIAVIQSQLNTLSGVPSTQN
ncbi:MAG: hypothetical protein ACRYGG_23760 [Janthinobacterium lividum]